MALKVINKINSRLRFLYRKNRFLSPPLRRLLCNSLIQHHFDYACSAWHPNFNKRLKSKLQILQYKCIQFCLNLNNRAHIGQNEFEQINWLPVNDRFNLFFELFICFLLSYINIPHHCFSRDHNGNKATQLFCVIPAIAPYGELCNTVFRSSCIN